MKPDSESKKPLVMVIDDNTMNAGILGDILEDNGYIPLLATSGSEALGLLEYNRPDIILLDIMMPEIDGYELCSRLKSSKTTKDIPVVFLTSKTDTVDIVKGFKIGAVDYVTKPYKAEELLARINTHVSIVQMQNKLELHYRMLAERNAVIEHQMAMARKIQQQFIPKKDPFDFISSLYKPMDKVGGDFYDYLFFREAQELGIFISDVSGHGVPAAFITSMVKTVLLQAGAIRENPAHLLSYLNTILYDNTDENFLTAFYGIFNFRKKTLSYSNAGHNPPFIIAEGQVRSISGKKGLPLAIFNNKDLQRKKKKFINNEISLPAGSKMLLYTDGLIDAFYDETSGDPYTERMFMEALNRLSELPLSCQKFVQKLYEELVDYRGSDSFEDDICMICIDL